MDHTLLAATASRREMGIEGNETGSMGSNDIGGCSDGIGGCIRLDAAAAAAK
jgi:hypothetical protein